jgi:hypothetical protein
MISRRVRGRGEEALGSRSGFTRLVPCQTTSTRHRWPGSGENMMFGLVRQVENEKRHIPLSGPRCVCLGFEECLLGWGSLVGVCRKPSCRALAIRAGRGRAGRREGRNFSVPVPELQLAGRPGGLGYFLATGYSSGWAEPNTPQLIAGGPSHAVAWRGAGEAKKRHPDLAPGDPIKRFDSTSGCGPPKHRPRGSYVAHSPSLVPLAPYLLVTPLTPSVIAPGIFEAPFHPATSTPLAALARRRRQATNPSLPTSCVTLARRDM